jgi:hypothetical protein
VPQHQVLVHHLQRVDAPRHLVPHLSKALHDGGWSTAY